ISYINFELSQKLQNQYKAEAMKLAAEDARIKAEAVAEGFNKEVGDLISTSVNDFGYYPWNVYSTRGMGVAEDYALAKVEATNIQPGEKEVTASVSATFELK
ncbi:MAG TPA: SIMPL domain-containing protein, partial [Candidatus Nanoarchaeia archaeon]|nr:SIMPL domain-containing protein [Candidatus Nanoarchaeia archaeon]